MDEGRLVVESRDLAGFHEPEVPPRCSKGMKCCTAATALRRVGQCAINSPNVPSVQRGVVVPIFSAKPAPAPDCMATWTAVVSVEGSVVGACSGCSSLSPVLSRNSSVAKSSSRI